MSISEHFRFREAMVQRLSRDLIGPGSEDEVISDAPITRYIAGILFPVVDPAACCIAPQDEVDDDESQVDGRDNVDADPAVALAGVRYPSSIGLSFAVDASAGVDLYVEIDAGQYEAIGTGGDDTGSGRRRRAGATGPGGLWRRVARQFPKQTVRLSAGDVRLDVGHGLELFVRVRARDQRGVMPVTVAITNRNRVQLGAARDSASFFQPRVRVSTGPAAAIVERSATGIDESDADLRSYGLLYRHVGSYGVGHGCAVSWGEAAGNNVDFVETTFLPRHDLLLADSNPAIDSSRLGMGYLASASAGEIRDALVAMTDDYQTWISGQQELAANLAEPLRVVASEHLANCMLALSRMQCGIETLESDPEALRAFRFANEAMLLQRRQSAWVSAGRREHVSKFDAMQKWRPFQIAFVLQCLPGLVDAKSADRDIADLLWFPTGGGKTEAYLGLIAFAIAIRRLRGGGGGVTALMRYTLRLLTIQQFERAAKLVCALEAIRRNHVAELGREEISIGLWVGKRATPNDLDEARRALDQARNGTIPSEGNPMQVHACPWCGHKLTHKNYWIGSAPRRLVISCGEVGCEFEKKLPIYVVDSDLYETRPTLLIATADKFAAMPWRKDVASLFNLSDPTGAPPELIVQDELHLISGPLGTLAGLYETAIDLACEQSGVRPKVVASTATIRRAANQSLALFARTVQQFPPPGIDARNSYFACEVDRHIKGSRLYVGIMAPGTSQATLLVRVFASLIQSGRGIEGDDQVRDAYWTLVGYFNSLRVLGGAKLQLHDDVRERIRLLAQQFKEEPRSIEPVLELTSREESGEVPMQLEFMGCSFPSPDAVATILATNMISVGVDIDRLGLMAVMGQPQTTSEYIQATSRVGRRHPGLVVTMLNAARTRDRSHYESFVSYHAALYRQVESTSVTPFSARARDRGLHAVLIALARLLIVEARDEAGAARIESFEDQLRTIALTIVRRVAKIAPDEVDAVSAELNEIILRWKVRARQTPGLVYRNDSHPDRALLGDVAKDDEADAAAFPTMWSLRDVDRGANLFEVFHGQD